MSSDSLPSPARLSLTARAPLFLASIWLIAGILAEACLPAASPWAWWLGLAALWMLWASWRRRVAFYPMTGLRLAAACIALGGAWAASIERRALEAGDRVRVRLRAVAPETPLILTGRLADWPEPAVGRVALDVDAATLRLDERMADEPARGRIRLMLPLQRPEQVADWERLALAPGDRVAVKATLDRRGRYENPGGPDAGAYLDWRGADARGQVLLLTRLQAAEAGCGAWLGKLRLWAIRQLQQDFDARTGGLLAGIALGSDRFLDAAWAERFRRSGLFHLLVISGSHFALVAGIVAWLLSLMTRRRWIAAIAILTVVWCYAWLVGLDPPVWRAAVAVTVWQAARLFYREPDWLNALGACACVLLVMQPSNLFAPSFQLTFGAVLALAGAAAPLQARLRAIGEWRPTRATPYPPAAPPVVRRFAEALFWRESRFQKRMRREPVTYRLDKSPWAARLERLGYGDWNAQTALRWAFGILLAGACVQVALLPMSLAYFNRIAPAGGVATLVAEVVLTATLLCALGYFVALGLFPPAAAPFKWLATRSVECLTAVADLGSRWGDWRAPHWEGWGLAVYGGFALGCWLLGAALRGWRPLDCPSRSPRQRWLFALGAALCLVFGWLTVIPPRDWRRPPLGCLRVTFLDVGQGDCILLEFPTGETLLVDSGGQSHEAGLSLDGFREDAIDIGERVVARCLWARGIARLNGIIATHPDSDHVGGFRALAQCIRIGQAWHGQAQAADPIFRRLAQELDRHGIPRRVVQAGLQTRIGAVRLTCLWPPPDVAPTGTNQDSLVWRLDYGRRSFLLTSDIEARDEQALVAASAPLACDVVKAPHHGSRSSSSADFVSATGATHVVFSAPRQSPFGHPHAEVVNRYARLLPRAGQWHTGRDGAITFETDGETLRVYSQARQRA
ncbi:MAG: hypothetical protein CFK52_10125 [Chloracidobacterium sp. CP2_5A]|nr:MAG: hypothetical protein CFK52_10125 [Chloracidobacterium sp. CP2_5A]